MVTLRRNDTEIYSQHFYKAFIETGNAAWSCERHVMSLSSENFFFLSSFRHDSNGSKYTSALASRTHVGGAGGESGNVLRCNITELTG